MIVAITAITPPTRCEFNWARSQAPYGPTSTINTAGLTQVDLGSVYPIRLCRFFFPNAEEIVNINDLDTTYAVRYFSRVVNVVWNWGYTNLQTDRPFYDAQNGASFYNVVSGGGSFNLDKWITGGQSRCNCYDLAAIVQLGCCLLIDAHSNDLSNSRWVYQIPTGFVDACLLYGWSTVYPLPPGVNNPFFANVSKLY